MNANSHGTANKKEKNVTDNYNEGQKCWDTFVKWPLFEYWTYLSPSPVYLHPSPPKSMLYFGPSSLSFTSDNIDSGGEGIYGV